MPVLVTKSECVREQMISKVRLLLQDKPYRDRSWFVEVNRLMAGEPQ